MYRIVIVKKILLNIQKIDFPLVSETNFTELNYVKIPTCTTYITNHADGTAHAGSGIIITNGVKDHELAKYETDRIQAMNISF
jgi:hypothetical protein